MTRILVLAFLILSGIYIASPSASEAALLAAFVLPAIPLSWAADHHGVEG